VAVLQPAEPRGFRSNTAGLLVPEDLSRKRQVWTKDEWRLLDRVTKLLQGKGVELFLACPDCRTAGKDPLERISTPEGRVLRCACTDRIFRSVS
jgi:hypothetical protein